MPRKTPRPAQPLDSASLERAALDYAARYATTRARLAAYLRRKLRERGWAGSGDPPVADLVGRFAERGYVDDRVFAAARTDALLRRGYGVRRIGAALRAAGIDAETAGDLDERIDAEAEAAVLRFARRKRIGPFADGAADPERKRRWIAAMARAGHPMPVILKMLDSGIDEIENET
jgi:regulatory protein